MRIAAAAALALVACGKPPTPSQPGTPAASGDEEADPGGAAVTPAPGGTTAAGAIDAEIGTPHPIVLEATAADGTWVAICQARTDTNGDGQVAVRVGHHGDTFGDDFVPYLVRGSGPGEELQSFMTSTRDGKWVVAKRKGQLALLDVAQWKWTELLGADLRDDGVPIGPHRNASLAADGARLAYLRGDNTVVIRDLDDGAERAVTIPKALVWRVEVDAAGIWARVYVVRKDGDGDGKLGWPQLRTSLSARDCRGPIMSYSTGGWSGDPFETVWLELGAGTIVDEGDVVIGPAGPHLVRTPKSGALTLDGKELAPPACKAEVVAISPAPPRVLYTCKPRSKGASTPLEIAGAGGVRHTTGLAVERQGPDRDVAIARGWYCEGGGCVDVATGKDRALPTGEPIAHDGPRVLISADDALSVLDLNDGTSVALPVKGSRGPQRGPIIAIDQQLVDLATAKLLGAITGSILAVDTRGRALVGPDERGHDLPRGPLHWTLPK